MKTLATIILILGSAITALSQTAVIKANSMTFTLGYQGTNYAVTGPAQDTTIAVTLPAATAAGQVLTSTGANSIYTAQTPASSGSGLPSGLTFTGGVFTVNGAEIVTGGLSVSTVTLTGGAALPTCTSELFVQQLNTTTDALTYACLPLPKIVVTQPASNSFTFTAQ